ncbi:MAG: hypothetical protein HY000_15645, partial [Planctomycetes bacterium]|nr:hypothetical protein [Planctomycetota bacterium]
VVWLEAPGQGQAALARVIVYLEGNARVHQGDRYRHEKSLMLELATQEPPKVDAPQSFQQHGEADPLYRRALAQRQSAGYGMPPQGSGALASANRAAVSAGLGPPVQTAEYLAEVVDQTVVQAQAMPPTIAPAQPAQPPPARRIRMYPRSSVKYQAEVIRREGPPPEHVAIVTGGVNVLIEGVEGFGTIDVQTDRMVLWTRATDAPNVFGETQQSGDTPLEMYLEGNVVIRQGTGTTQRVIKADQVYYDVDDNRAEVVHGELKMFAPKLQGPVRMYAERFSQLAKDRFYAQQGWVSTSKLGKPGYRIQSSDVYLEDESQLLIQPETGLPEIDPITGEPMVGSRRRLTAVNNVFFVDEIPLFYWPTVSTSLDDANIALERFRVRQDRIFGTQVLTTWDMYDLLGLARPPENTRWRLELDYLSERGPAIGTDLDYRGTRLFGVDGPYRGILDTWWIADDGSDTLGNDRRNLDPEESTRGRFLWRHRHELPGDFTLLAELGLLSDRNFLEQYFEHEFDEDKDFENLVYLKQQRDHWAWSVLVCKRLMDFLTQTDWLPRLDHYLLGEALWEDQLTWFTHSYAGYADLRPASTPEELADAAKFVRRPWERRSQALLGATRHEIDYPFSLGPIRLVPYVMGELAGWTKDLTGEEEGRAFGAVGVRGSVPFWRIYPWVGSRLWNVHGLAHKIVVDWDYSLAGSSLDMMQLPLFNELDDDSTEHFRRRFAVNTFGGMIPLTFDERFYALRSGVQNSVSTPYTEIADDFQALRAGIRQRLQTKRGPVDNQHIIDWMTLDLEGAWFPDEDRDNFGEPLGLLGYDYLWHVGDRTSLLSSGQWDTFDNAGSVWSIGGLLDRPPRGNFYLGYDVYNGPIESQFLTFSYNYVMSPKWVSSFVTQVDLGLDRNVGQSLVLTRVGADFLLSFGFRVDANKDNVGLQLALQPRIAPDVRLGRVRGVRVPQGAVAPFE